MIGGDGNGDGRGERALAAREAVHLNRAALKLANAPDRMLADGTRARSSLPRSQTQFEAWLAMQQAPDGLRSAEEGKRRWTIVPIYNASDAFAHALEEMWARR